MEDAPILTSNQALLRWSRDTPAAIAVASRRRSIPYSHLAGHVARFAVALEAAGLGKGMIVGLLCADRYLRLALTLALEVIGATPSQLSPPGSARAGFLDALSHCDALCADEPLPARVPCRLAVPLAAGWIESVFRQPVTDTDLEPLARPSGDDEPVFMGSSSGTTGKKKYFFEHRIGVRSQVELISKLYFMHDTDFIAVYDFTVGGAYIGCAAAFNRGGTFVLSSLRSFFADVQERPASHAVMLLRDVDILMRDSAGNEPRQKLGSMRVLGSALPPLSRRWLEKHVAKRVANSYSTNETGQIAEVGADGVAQLYPGVEVRILGTDGSDLAAPEVGLVAVKTGQKISAYLGDPELTRRHFRDGWFITNDLGHLLGHERLVVHGRADDMLILGGIKIVPAPIETRLKQIPGIEDCALIAGAPEVGTARLFVCIQTSGRAARAQLEERVSELLAGRVRDFAVLFFDELPRTETGKIRRKALAQIVREKAGRVA